MVEEWWKSGGGVVEEWWRSGGGVVGLSLGLSLSLSSWLRLSPSPLIWLSLVACALIGVLVIDSDSSHARIVGAIARLTLARACALAIAMQARHRCLICCAG